MGGGRAGVLGKDILLTDWLFVMEDDDTIKYNTKCYDALRYAAIRYDIIKYIPSRLGLWT